MADRFLMLFYVVDSVFYNLKALEVDPCQLQLHSTTPLFKLLTFNQMKWYAIWANTDELSTSNLLSPTEKCLKIPLTELCSWSSLALNQLSWNKREKDRGFWSEELQHNSILLCHSLRFWEGYIMFLFIWNIL